MKDNFRINSIEIDQSIKQLETWLNKIEESLDSPIWKEYTFVYEDITVKHVAFLKAIRAVSSLYSLPLLYDKGLFIDAGSIIRCIYDCLNEIFFLLEDYPSTNPNIDKFIKHFTSTSILENEEVKTVLSRKIHSAQARIFKDQFNADDLQKKIRNIYKTFSGYIHSNYPAIMEIYGGSPEELKFHMSGVNNTEKKREYVELIEQTIASARLAITFIALKFGLNELLGEIRKS
jgi:hypothetical protein